MEIIKNITNLNEILSQIKKKNEKLCFIPTMGALHDGHISLINTAHKKLNHYGYQNSSKILVSIFVNPTQFDDKKDLEKYPNTLEKDIKKLQEKKVDYLFIPDILEMYPSNNTFLQKSEIFLPDIFSRLEGKTRKGHFEGVFQVVHRLFSLIHPDFAVFGQKDFQQVLLIKYLQKKYFPNIKIIVSPLFREQNGLAYSSRNMLFSQEEKSKACILYKTLQEIQKIYKKKKKNSLEKIKTQEIISLAQKFLKQEPLVEKIHYIAICNRNTLHKKKYLEKGDVILISIKFSGVHLIDNSILE